jgi:hypothetical protein
VASSLWPPAQFKGKMSFRGAKTALKAKIKHSLIFLLFENKKLTKYFLKLPNKSETL